MDSTEQMSLEGHRHGRVPREIRKRQLLDVADRIFGELGYQGASIEAVAEAAGVTRPMVYNYFGSKKKLYLQCVQRARQQLEADMETAAASAQDLRERMARVADAYFQFVEKHAQAWDVLFDSDDGTAGPAAKEARDMRFGTVSRIAAMLRAETGPVLTDRDLEAFAHAMSGCGEQLAKWWRTQPDVSRAQIVEYQVALCWDGFRHLRERTGPNPPARSGLA